MIVSHYSDIYIEDPNLRPYQQKAKKEIFEAWDKVDNVMFQMPTGTGKTRLFTSIIKDIDEYSKRIKEPINILIIAHRTELIDQIDKSLDKYQVHHNVIAGGKGKNFEFPVYVASIQTLTNPDNLAYAKKLDVQFIIIDEAHHALASSYKKLWYLYPGSKKLGVTATPWRMDHHSFTDLFDTLVMSMPIKDFIRQGVLSPYKYYSLRSDSDIQKTIDGLELNRFGEYSDSSMEEKMDVGSIRAQLLDSYQSLAKGKKGIIYAINIEHARHICSEYEAAGYKTVCIDSKTPTSERKELVEEFRKGQIDIIVNVDIFSEGFDCPDIEFIQLARPTRSLVKYLQQVGRGLRVTDNKQECVILDNVGMYARFGLPNARRHWRQHFLGEDVSEEPKSGVFRGTGLSGNRDLSEGTEDMVLIQDINEDETDGLADDSQDESFDPIGILEANNFQCDNYIFYFKQSKKMFETYIQDDKYFIISELIIDEDNQCVHRKRVGKIPSDSWMYWQMLTEKIDEIKSITHYSENYTVFHYRVLSTDSKTLQDRYFDYTGKEIDAPQTVLIKALEERKAKNYVDLPVSKASFKVVLDNHFYMLFRTIKGVTKPIARMSSTSNFGLSHELDVARKNEERKSQGLPQIRLYNTDQICVLRSDDNSFTIKKVENGKGYFLQYDLNGKLLQTTTTASVTSIEKNPLKEDDIEKLKHTFNRNSNSYKYFWFMSLLQIYKETQVENIQFKQILVKMISKAWKYVFMLHGHFSQTDRLPIVLMELQQETKLRNSSTVSEVEDKLNKEYDSLKLESKLSPVLKNVPYRFLSPWIPFTDNEEVMRKSWCQETRCPYELYTDHVVISKLWRKDFVDYYEAIQLLTEYGLDSYLMISQNNKEANDFYNKRFESLDQLLERIKKRKTLREVKQFLEKYHFPLTGEITSAAIMKKIPNSRCVIDSEGRKHVHVPCDLWSLRILDKLLSKDELIDSYDNVQQLADYGLLEFQKKNQREKVYEDINKVRFTSLSRLLNRIKKNKEEEIVKQFLIKHNFPLTGEITPVDIIKRIPDSKCVIDREGRKRVNVPDGVWTFKGLDKLLSE